ncbi:MAG TPA: DUF1854 domain-containing protein [Candidatus Limnocylindria bacterium]|jgi:hypothetical protein|nr:DUF1854 domain-containing protein [Candidatus Limnocylindria bacterium]
MSTPTTSDKNPETPASLVEASQLAFLDPGILSFTRHGVTLRLTIADDRCFARVSILRAFPLSDPSRYLSVRDEANKEIGLIVDPTKLSPENRTLVLGDLERRYLVPVVKRIVAAKERFGTVDWTLETDRGLCRFTTRNLRENVQRPAPGRIILTDVDGNRYDIQKIDELSVQSQELLFQHI